MNNWQEVVLSFADFKFGKGNHTIKWERKTRYCGLILFRVDCGKWEGLWIVKMIMPEDMGQGNADLAHFFNDSTLCFRDLLHYYKVPLSKTYEFDVFHDFAVQTSSYEGLNCEVLIGDDNSIAPKVFRQILEAINFLLSQRSRSVGLDPQLSNFCIAKNKAVYTDTFPPLCLYQGNYLVHYPNPPTPEGIAHELRRKYEPLGVLRRLRFSALAFSPKLASEFEKAIEVLDQPLRKEASDFFASLPNGDIGRMSPTQVLRLIDNLDPYDVETRREVAALILPIDSNRQKLLAEVFIQTSMVPLPHFPPLEERLDAYRQMMAAHLKS